MSLAREGPEQAELQGADLVPFRPQLVHDVLHRAGGRTHGHDDIVGILRAVSFDHIVLAPGDLPVLLERCP